MTEEIFARQRETLANAKPEWEIEFIRAQVYTAEFDELLEDLLSIEAREKKIASRWTSGGRSKGTRKLEGFISNIREDFIRVISHLADRGDKGKYSHWTRFKNLAYKYPNKYASERERLDYLAQEAMLQGPIELYKLLYESVVGDLTVMRKPNLLRGNRWSSIQANLIKKENSRWVAKLWPAVYTERGKLRIKAGELLERAFGGNFSL